MRILSLSKIPLRNDGSRKSNYTTCANTYFINADSVTSTDIFYRMNYLQLIRPDKPRITKARAQADFITANNKDSLG